MDKVESGEKVYIGDANLINDVKDDGDFVKDDGDFLVKSAQDIIKKINEEEKIQTRFEDRTIKKFVPSVEPSRELIAAYSKCKQSPNFLNLSNLKIQINLYDKGVEQLINEGKLTFFSRISLFVQRYIFFNSPIGKAEQLFVYNYYRLDAKKRDYIDWAVTPVKNESQRVVSQLKLPDGGIYTGQIRDGLPHGQGTVYIPKERLVYSGEFENGKKQGVGTSSKLMPDNKKWVEHGMFKDGEYVGPVMFSNDEEVIDLTSEIEPSKKINSEEIKDYKTIKVSNYNIEGGTYTGSLYRTKFKLVPHGEGKFTTFGGTEYEGIFKHGFLTEGKVTYSKGDWEQGTFEGNELKKGVSYSNKILNIGEFDRNHMKSGKIIYPDGKEKLLDFKYANGVYNGFAIDDTPNGIGSLKVNDTIFEGTFANGEFKKGVKHHPDGKMEAYNLEFKKDNLTAIYNGPLNKNKKFHGENGVLKISDGSEYSGEFEEGQLKNGKAEKMTFPDGVYTGPIENFQRNGDGVLIKSDGKYIGHFKEGKFDGRVTWYKVDSEGNTSSVEWINFKDGERI